MTQLAVRLTAIDDNAPEVLAELRDWLRLDLPGVRLEPVYRDPAPGEMPGGVLEALQTAVLSAEFLGMIVTGVGGWLSARATARRTKVRIKLGDNEIEIDASNAKDAEKLIRRLSLPPTDGLSPQS